MLTLAADEVAALGEGGFIIRDGCLGDEQAAAVHIEALALTAGLRPAGVSRGERRVDPAIRGDELLWLDPGDAPPAIARLLGSFRDLQDELNHEAYLGLGRFEVQLARYAPGAGYARHRDAFAGARDSRRATAIYYLNPGWTPAAGGLLRLHLAGGPVEVEPRLDRLVVFLSPLVEHEVLPAHAPRLAITAWYYGRDPLS